ncbi:DUF452 family protein [uncultured Bacteroides sp.]|uniref:DUF452 family protein n=1 Tax=uncultured Bacteroides sp. TaxID=162156 RepID=UPI0025E5A4AB|nr:pimeloyl-ACP methyl esterase BioG family protein [uncultured Bacteroides sp.]
MKQHFIIKSNSKHLLLFFAGWGMDETPFTDMRLAHCDWMICYDYRSLEFDESLLRGYSEITLVGWSMGVWAASRIMELYPGLPVSRSIAVNGTIYPVDESKGIAPIIFAGTLQGLTGQTLQKFQRRMCGSSAEYKVFQSVAPQRPVEELKEELAAIQKQYLSSDAPDFRWQKAIIGRNDRIFTPENQRRAWENNVDQIEESEAAHYQRELFQTVLTGTSSTLNLHQS